MPCWLLTLLLGVPVFGPFSSRAYLSYFLFSGVPFWRKRSESSMHLHLKYTTITVREHCMCSHVAFTQNFKETWREINFRNYIYQSGVERWLSTIKQVKSQHSWYQNTAGDTNTADAKIQEEIPTCHRPIISEWVPDSMHGDRVTCLLTDDAYMYITRSQMCDLHVLVTNTILAFDG